MWKFRSIVTKHSLDQIWEMICLRVSILNLYVHEVQFKLCWFKIDCIPLSFLGTKKCWLWNWSTDASSMTTVATKELPIVQASCLVAQRAKLVALWSSPLDWTSLNQPAWPMSALLNSRQSVPYVIDYKQSKISCKLSTMWNLEWCRLVNYWNRTDRSSCQTLKLSPQLRWLRFTWFSPLFQIIATELPCSKLPTQM